MNQLFINSKYPMPSARRRRAWTAAMGLLAVVVVGLVLSLVLAGCSKSPVEAPATTVISGVGSIAIPKNNVWNNTYSFRSGGFTYGNIGMVSYDTENCIFQGYGIQIVTGNSSVAPEDGYLTSAGVVWGQSYFFKSDEIPHYGRLIVTGINRIGKATSITVTFDWVLQTEGGNRSLQ